MIFFYFVTVKGEMRILFLISAVLVGQSVAKSSKTGLKTGEFW